MMDGRMGRFTAFIVASLGVFGSYGDPPGAGGPEQAGTTGAPAIPGYAWCDDTTYRPPDFNRYFPDSEVGAD